MLNTHACNVALRSTSNGKTSRLCATREFYVLWSKYDIYTVTLCNNKNNNKIIVNISFL